MNKEINRIKENEIIESWVKDIIKHHKRLSILSKCISGHGIAAIVNCGLCTRDGIYYETIDVTDVFRIAEALCLPVRVHKYPIDNLNVCTVLFDDYLLRTVLDDEEFKEADKCEVTIEMMIQGGDL